MTTEPPPSWIRRLAIVFVVGVWLALVVTTSSLIHQQVVDPDSHHPHFRTIIITASMIPPVMIVGYLIVRSV